MNVTTAQPERGVPESTVPGTGDGLQDGRQQRWRKWVLRGVLAAGLAVLFVLVSLGILALADFDMAGNGSSSVRARAEWAWASGDHLHYAVHILAGRVLDICPCTRRAAGAQYWRAHFHAVTPRQQSVAANTHPSSAAEWGAYVVGPAQVGFDWMSDGVSWLAGNRPAREVVVGLDQYNITPSEIHVLRGTRVTWRNVDELGEAHAITADSGQLTRFDSDFLEPDEQFAYTFTARGRYLYYCRVHGAPGLQGMAGVVVVE